MKKPNISPMIVLTLLFALVLTGIYCIRNDNREPVCCEIVNEEPSLSNIMPDNSGLININTASREELCTLPGIGEILAQRIINHRKVHGRFESLDALLNVEGIGKGKLESIIDYITTGGN